MEHRTEEIVGHPDTAPFVIANLHMLIDQTMAMRDEMQDALAAVRRLRWMAAITMLAAVATLMRAYT